MLTVRAVVAGVVLAAVTVCGGLWQQLHAERAVSADLRARLGQLEAEQGRVTASGAGAIESPASAEMKQASVIATPQVPANVASVPIGEKDLLKDPEYREARRMRIRESLSKNYGDLGKELGLSHQEEGALLDLLAQRALDSMEHGLPAAPGQGDENARLAGRALFLSQEGEFRALLGDDKYQKWRAYRQSMPARRQVDQLRDALAASGGALTDEQARLLVAAAGSEQQGFNQQLAEDGNRQLLDAATAYLQPGQLAAYERILSQELVIRRAGLAKPAEIAR